MLIDAILVGDTKTILENIVRATPETLEKAIRECLLTRDGLRISGLIMAAQELSREKHPGAFEALILKIRPEALTKGLLDLEIVRRSGYTVLHYSAEHHSSEAFQTLLARVKAEYIQELSDRVLARIGHDEDGKTLLHLIYSHQSWENLLLFLSKVNDNLRQSFAAPARGSYTAISTGYYELIDGWINAIYAEQNLQFFLPNRHFELQNNTDEGSIDKNTNKLALDNGSETLFVAVRKELKELIRENRDFTQTNPLKLVEGSEIHFAVLNNDTKKLYEFLREGRVFTQANSKHISPWQIALSAKPINCFVLLALIEGGVNPNELGLDGQSLLHVAVLNEWSLGIIKMFIRLGLDVNKTNSAGLTALGSLLDKGYIKGPLLKLSAMVPAFSEEHAQFLLDNGADVHSRNQAGKSWRALAFENKDTRRVKKFDGMLKADDALGVSVTKGEPQESPLIAASIRTAGEKPDAQKNASKAESSGSLFSSMQYLLFGKSAAAAASSASTAPVYGPAARPQTNPSAAASSALAVPYGPHLPPAELTPGAPLNSDNAGTGESAQSAYVYAQQRYSTVDKQSGLKSLPPAPGTEPELSDVNNRGDDQKQQSRGYPRGSMLPG